MFIQSTVHIENLIPFDAILLTKLLSLPPGQPPTPEWLCLQAGLISTLPPILQKPTSLFPRITMALSFNPSQGHLCNTHTALNPHILHEIFLQLSLESDITRLTSLLTTKSLPPTLAAFTTRMLTLNTLWTSPHLYLHLHQDADSLTITTEDSSDATPPPLTTHLISRIPSGCEACILSCVGGNKHILCSLRAAIRGRRRRGRRDMGIVLGLVEAWISEFAGAEEIKSQSDVLAREIMRWRRRRQVERRQVGGNGRRVVDGGRGVVERDEVAVVEGVDVGVNAMMPSDDAKADEDEEDGEEHDFETSIIDFYANLPSTRASLISKNSLGGILAPPAITPGIAHPPILTTTMQRPYTVYSESEYGGDSGFCGSSSNLDSGVRLPNHDSERHAQAYRILVGIEEKEDLGGGGDRERKAERQTRPEDRMTRWTDFMLDERK